MDSIRFFSQREPREPTEETPFQQIRNRGAHLIHLVESNENVHIIQGLLQEGVLQSDQERAFLKAFKYGFLNLAQILLDGSISENTILESLQSACKNKNEDLVRLILDNREIKPIDRIRMLNYPLNQETYHLGILLALLPANFDLNHPYYQGCFKNLARQRNLEALQVLSRLKGGIPPSFKKELVEEFKDDPDVLNILSNAPTLDTPICVKDQTPTRSEGGL